MKYNVVERFTSINGEGMKAGKLAVFIRFAGCNLRCTYCDTMWANDRDVACEVMTAEEIYDYIKGTGIGNVTITGGEPLIQPGVDKLLELLSGDRSLSVEIETNGSVQLKDFMDLVNPPSFTMDYKLPSSGMENEMEKENFSCLTEKDTLKFVVGTMEDLERADELIRDHRMTDTTNVYFSPVYGQLPYEEIVDFMKERNLVGVTFQLQLHKFIWNPEERSV